jgi:hypothetical protein
MNENAFLLSPNIVVHSTLQIIINQVFKNMISKAKKKFVRSGIQTLSHMTNQGNERIALNGCN